MGSKKKDKKTEKEADGDFEINFDEPILTSGVVCKLLDIPVWVLKQLDKQRIVSPPRKKGKSRLYSRKELNRLNRIWYLMKNRNVNVDGVKVILEMKENNI